MATVASRWVRRALIATGVVVTLTGLIGLAHTPAGRPLLNALRGAPGCPVDLTGGDPKQIEAYRVAQLHKRVGDATERQRPALGFVLGKSTRDEVLRDLSARGASCTTQREGSVLRCALTARDKMRPEADLHLQFDAGARLVAADVLRPVRDRSQALASLQALRAELAEQVGPETRSYGPESAAQLGESYLAQVGSEYRYRHYVAELRATNLGPTRGFTVREQYQLLPGG